MASIMARCLHSSILFLLSLPVSCHVVNEGAKGGKVKMLLDPTHLSSSLPPSHVLIFHPHVLPRGIHSSTPLILILFLLQTLLFSLFICLVSFLFLWKHAVLPAAESCTPQCSCLLWMRPTVNVYTHRWWNQTNTFVWGAVCKHLCMCEWAS